MLVSGGNFGKPPNNADKRKAVLMLLGDAEWSAWSDREIAKHCHVSHPTVAAHRASLVNLSSEESPHRTYTTKHGTQATMNTGGQKAAAAQKKADANPSLLPPILPARSPKMIPLMRLARARQVR